MKARFLHDPYGTHQPVLYEAVMRTSGPVVEFGIGYNSTPWLHKLCDGRKLLSAETDIRWLLAFLHFASPGQHRFVLVKNLDALLRDIMAVPWSVAFVDQGAWDDRVATVMALKDKARFIVLHDCDYFVTHSLLEFDELFKYHKEFLPLEPWPYPRTGPPTLLASNFEDCDWDIDYEKYKGMECFA